MRYQLWDTLQVLCANLRGAVTTQAGLLAIGVGAAGATAENVIAVDMANALVANALGLVTGSLCKASGSAAAMKRWRLVNCALSTLGACLAVLQAMYPSQRLAILICGTCITATVGPLGGGASTQLVMHLANNSVDPAFRADVGAKESNQDRLLGLVLVATRYALLLAVGTDFARTWAAVVALSVLHVVFNVACVRVLVLRVLNRERLRDLLDAWECIEKVRDWRFDDATQSANHFPPPHRIANALGPDELKWLGPDTVAQFERVVPRRGEPWSLGTIGVRADLLLTGDAAHSAPGWGYEEAVEVLHEMHKNERYVLCADLRTRRLVVVLKEGATARDQLQAALQARSARDYIEIGTPFFRDRDSFLWNVVGGIDAAFDAVVDTEYDGGSPEWPAFEAALRAAGWLTDRVLFSAEDWRLPNDDDDDHED